jgi:hypothetical protein
MRRFLILLCVCCLAGVTARAKAATGRVIKVLPQSVDLQGRRSLSPSLYDRDAYQAMLLAHPDRCSGLSFIIQWKAHGGVYAPLKMRVEMMGTSTGDLPTRMVLEKEVKKTGWWSHWTSLQLDGTAYRELGKVTAWRVTLWEGDELRGEQRSFLW